MSTSHQTVPAPISSAELLNDLQSTISKLLIDLIGADRDLADDVALEVRNHLAEHWGGQNLYFPRDVSFKMSMRHEQIFEDFTGNNHSDLVRKYKVSLPWLYRILKKIHQRKLAEIQKPLF